MEGPVALLLPDPLAPDKFPVVDSAAPALVEQHPKPPDGRAEMEPMAPITTTTTFTTRGLPDCSLAVLFTRLGQQDLQLARDRHHISKLSQQLSDTTTQLTPHQQGPRLPPG